MDKYSVEISKSAERDLRDIARIVALTISAKETAKQALSTIQEGISKLETDALMAPFVKDARLAAIGYRVHEVGNNSVFYIVDERAKTVDVDRILFGGYSWRNII